MLLGSVHEPRTRPGLSSIFYGFTLWKRYNLNFFQQLGSMSSLTSTSERGRTKAAKQEAESDSEESDEARSP